MEVIFFCCAMISVIGILFICYFIFKEGIPFIYKVGIKEFLFGTQWAPSNSPPSYGILPMIMGSVYVTIGALIIGVPLGLLTSIFLAFYASEKMLKFLHPAIQLMSGIPSIVYGFFALTILVPWVRTIFGGTGMSILTSSILLGIMIIPTIVGLSESSLRSVPQSYYQGSIALGASSDRTVFKIMLPAAKSGILASIILGIGRAIGETMAVVLVAGNQSRMPTGILNGTRTMTTNIVMEMSYASGEHRTALIATGAILFIFILCINLGFIILKKRGEK